MTESEQSATATRLSRSRLALLIAIPAVVALSLAAGLTDYVSLDALAAHRSELLAFVAAHHTLAVIVFTALYFAGVALSIPGWGLLTVPAGFLFGPALGAAIVVFAATSGGAVVVLAARYVLTDSLRAKAAPAIRKLEAGFHENAFSYLLALRLTPVLPFFLVTLAVAFLGVRMRTFLAATTLGLIPIASVYATLGAGIGDALEVGAHDPLAAAREPTVIGGLLGLAALALLPVLIKRLRRR
ncbi:MAG: TVP38/TMEM64 family protein [Rhodospirillaceae bacterium]